MRHGDCLNLLGDVKRGSVPLVITDPPYFTPPAQFVSGRSHHRRSLSNLSLLDHFYDDLFARLIPVLRDDASLYIFCDSQSYPLYYAYLYERVNRLRLLVWDRGTAINGYTWRYRCQYILFAQMQEAPAVKTGDGDLIVCPAVPVAQRTHAAEKPQKLLKQLILKSSQPGDLVLDCFAGTASTGLACARTGRSFLGFELDYQNSLTGAERLAAAGSAGRPEPMAQAVMFLTKDDTDG
jgi:site-specific DNA-methyltransferase (adenine-specific)